MINMWSDFPPLAPCMCLIEDNFSSFSETILWLYCPLLCSVSSLMDYLVLPRQTPPWGRWGPPPHSCLQCLGCDSSPEASAAPQCVLILMTSNHPCAMSKKGKPNEKGEKKGRGREWKRERGPQIENSWQLIRGSRRCSLLHRYGRNA